MMGYSTDFEGSFALDKEPSHKIQETLDDWADCNGPISGFCQWVINPDNMLVWDGGEKFYDYVEWLEHIIKLFKKEGITLNGSVLWDGEERGDIGKITIINNIIKTEKGI